MSVYPQLAEGDYNLIADFIKANIGAALDTVAAKVSTPQMQIDNPKSYYNYEEPQAYELPAIFVIHDDIDFKVGDRKPNSVNADSKINISVLVEDQDARIVTYKAWRYLSALFTILNVSTLKSSDNSLVLKLVIYRARFSQTYSKKEEGTPGATFRKEVLFECVATHLENF